MLWFVASCNSHYKSLDSLKSVYKLTSITPLPGMEDIKGKLGDSSAGFIAPYYPEKNIRSLFVIKELDNLHGVRTEQEVKYAVSEETVIYNRLGLEATKPKITLANIGGAERLKAWAAEVRATLARGEFVKGAFLIGPTGSGKTRFVEAFAGDFKRTLIMLNLPIIMEMENPIERLWGTFAYLQKMTAAGQKFVLLADEFEKMVDATHGSPIQKQFLGQLLTILNDMNSPTGFKVDAIIFATANNLSVILDNNPELLRHGRWSAKFFLNYPTRSAAIEIYRLYARIYGLNQFLNDDALNRLYSAIEGKWKKYNLQPHRSIYSPAEINALMERLKSKSLSSGGVVTEADVSNTIDLIIPIQKTAERGVGQQLKDAESGFEEC